MERSKHIKSEKEQERYYLLPGQGGRGWQRKRKWMLCWAVGAGLVISAVVALTIFLLHRAGY